MPFHDAHMLTPFDLSCPYGGESIEILVEPSAGDQHYLEDCQVCCRPITLNVHLDDNGGMEVRASSENDV